MTRKRSIDSELEKSGDWARRAACRGLDPALFYPERGAQVKAATAKAVCRTCPVVGECRSAGQEENFGIWGGLSLDERKERQAQPKQWRKGA